ncbi:hypothetical protein MSPP1_000464 [Malassezia sp. CBS 17886]|nr:hypothetical protein MSPP1_000464 [Malassezia sp. CBS 17886]
MQDPPAARIFPLDRALLAPAFDAYKLVEDETAAGTTQHAHALPRPAAVYHGAELGFKELKARALRHALVVAPQARSDATPTCAYVDADGSVQLVSLDAARVPTFRTIFRAAAAPPAEVSLCAVAADVWLVCDGTLGAAVLRVPADGGAPPPTTARGRLDDVEAPGHAGLWHLVDAAADGSAHAVALFQRARRVPTSSEEAHAGVGAPPTRAAHAASDTRMDVVLARIALDGAQPAEVIWRGCGAEPVSFTVLGAGTGAYVLGAGAPFHAGGDVAQQPPPRPVDEAVEAPPLPPPAPPFSWTQTHDTVSVALPLPGTLDKSEIRVHFSQQGLSASLTPHDDGRAPQHDGETRMRKGEYQTRAVWGEIDAAKSVWTWEPNPETTGVLTLHLAKAHEGTRWPLVFPDAPDIPETMDPSQLYAAMRGVDKYTAMGGTTNETDIGVGTAGASSLLYDGLEDEDAIVGRPLVVTQVCGANADARVSHSGAADQATVLATPAPSNAGDAVALLKSDVEGLVFAAPPLGTCEPLPSPWTHVESVPAISYVLASKRDAHPVYVFHPTHDASASSVVLALEPRRAGNAAGSQMYIYRVPHALRRIHGAVEGAPSKFGESRVLRLGGDAHGGAPGPVLGVAVLSVPRGDDVDAVVLALSESALTVVDRAW